MTLKEIVLALNGIAEDQPNIGQTIDSGDIYDLNSERDAKFSVFCLTQGDHTSNIPENTMTYNFYLYFVDRLQSDSTNKIDIQSTGIQTLNNIIRTFVNEYEDDIIEVSAINYSTFTERFSELCAGVYATLAVTVEDYNKCPEYF